MDLVTAVVLPLVTGGTLHVGRPFSLDRVAQVLDRVHGGAVEASVLGVIARRRHALAAAILPGASAPDLDEAALRLAAAAHNLMVTIHPGLDAAGLRGLMRVSAETSRLADLPEPRSAGEVVARHTMLARMPDVKRRDWSVHLWFGSRTLVGRRPPRRLTALPWLRRVRVASVTRSWLGDLPLPTAARTAYLRLLQASPLNEALDPLRPDPAPSWARLLTVLRFPPLARVVAARAVDLGVPRVGDALAAALLRLPGESRNQPGTPAAVEELVFAVRFLAHLVWMELLFVPSDPQRSSWTAPPGRQPWLAAVLSAAAAVDPSLLWPDDVPRDGDAGRAFAARLREMESEARQDAPEQLRDALELLGPATRQSRP